MVECYILPNLRWLVDATRLKAVDLLNQMEGVYINKIESKTAQLVELVIVTEEAPTVSLAPRMTESVDG